MTQEEAIIEIEGFLYLGKDLIISEDPELILEAIVHGLTLFCFDESWESEGDGFCSGWGDWSENHKGYGSGEGWGLGARNDYNQYRINFNGVGHSLEVRNYSFGNGSGSGSENGRWTEKGLK